MISNAIEELRKCAGTMAVNVVYITEPKFNKRGNPFYQNSEWSIEKVCSVNTITGASYQNSVNNQLDRESKETNFISQPIWGGKGSHIDRFLIRHIDNGKQYIKMLPTDVNNVQYRYKATKLPLNASEIKLLMKFQQKQSDSSRQGTNKMVNWNLVDLENLIQMTFNHKTYSK